MPMHTEAEREREQSPAERAKVSQVMREFEAGTLRSSSGEKVTSRDQALAIALSEARKVKDNSIHNSDNGDLRESARASLDGVNRRALRGTGGN